MRLANEAHGEVRIGRAGGKAGCKAVAAAQLIEREAGALLAFQERLHHAGVLLARDRARGIRQRTARGHVAPGGALAYSTCTVTREENAGVVKAFLESEEGAGFTLDQLCGRNCLATRLAPGSSDAHFAVRFVRKPQE